MTTTEAATTTESTTKATSSSSSSTLSATSEKTNRQTNHHYVGIRNVSKVSCYISSAIQLLRHVMNETDQQSLIDISQILSSSCCKNRHWIVSKNSNDSNSNSSNNDHLIDPKIDFLIHFGHLLDKMKVTNVTDSISSSSCSIAIDPSDLYKVLPSKLDSSVAGDAATSLRILMQFLRQSIDYLCDDFLLGLKSGTDIEVDVDVDVDEISLEHVTSSLRESLHRLFWNGTLKHQIQGSKIIVTNANTNEHSSNTKSSSSSPSSSPSISPSLSIGSKTKQQLIRIVRSKPSKERPLSCIITLPIQKDNNNNLIDAFNNIINKPQRINGYDDSYWDNMSIGEYHQEEIKMKQEQEQEKEEQQDTIRDKDENSNTQNDNETIIQNMDYLAIDSSNHKGGKKGALQNILQEDNSNNKSNNKSNINNNKHNTKLSLPVITNCIQSSNEKKEHSEQSSSSSSSSISSGTSSSSSSTSASSSTTSSSSSSTSIHLNKWTTEKITWLGSNIPKCLTFQLKRFEYDSRKGQGQVQVLSKNTKMNIPMEFYINQNQSRVSLTCSGVDNNNSNDDDDHSDDPDNNKDNEDGDHDDNRNSWSRYTLTGAIVYTDGHGSTSNSNTHKKKKDEDISPFSNNNDNIGHYISYFKQRDAMVEEDTITDETNARTKTNEHTHTTTNTNTPNERWIKIDDEKTFPILVSNNANMTNINDDMGKEENVKMTSVGSENTQYNGQCKVISREKLLNMFGGINTKSGHWCAFVLVYEYNGSSSGSGGS